MCTGARCCSDGTVGILGGDQVILGGAGGSVTLGVEVVAVLVGMKIGSNAPVVASGAG